MAERARLHRRLAGMLRKRLHEARLGELADPRDRRGQRWRLVTLLHVALVGLCAGCRSLADVEQLTSNLSGAMRRWLGIGRRVPDTTLRELLCRLEPAALRSHLHDVIRAAIRRKALSERLLPFGVGRSTARAPPCPRLLRTAAEPQGNLARGRGAHRHQRARQPPGASMHRRAPHPGRDPLDGDLRDRLASPVEGLRWLRLRARSQRARRIEVFHRDACGGWLLSEAGPGEEIRLELLDVALGVDAVYADPLRT